MRQRIVSWALAACVLLSAYCVSFGPVLFVMSRLSYSETINGAIDLLYEPHYPLMYQQEWYFHYILAWTPKGSTYRQWTWAEYRARRDQDHPKP
jgi:hypothetical protein